MIGLGQSKKDIIHLVDFGLSKKYVDKYGNHTPYSNQSGMVFLLK